jgi:peptidoglycan/LPS O-acetylase OafA/YrhL
VTSMSGIIFPRFLRDLLFFLLGYFTRKYVGTLTKGNLLFLFIVLFVSHFSLFTATQLSFIPTYFNRYSWYLTPILGIYFMYYLTVHLSSFTLQKCIWNFVSLIDSSSYTIYLFHSSFIYIVLFIYSFAPSSNVFLRILPAFLLGIIVPVILHFLISRVKYVSFLFSIPYSTKRA